MAEDNDKGVADYFTDEIVMQDDCDMSIKA